MLSKEMKKPPSLLVPDDPRGYEFQSGIFVPGAYSDLNKDKTLKEANVTRAWSHDVMFGSRENIEKVLQLVHSGNPIANITLAARFLNYLAHNGNQLITEDSTQNECFKKALEFGISLGLTTSKECSEKSEVPSGFIYPQQLLATIAIAFLDPSILDERQTKTDNTKCIPYVLSILTDECLNAPSVEKGYTKVYYASLLRDFIWQLQLSGGKSIVYYRVNRFVALYAEALDKMTVENQKSIQEFLKNDLGIDFDELQAFIPILITTWLENEDFSKNPKFDVRRIPTDEGKKISNELLNKLSKSPADFHRIMLDAYSEAPRTFFRNPFTIAEFVNSPFIKITESEYILLSPQCLLRKIEVAIQTAFYRQNVDGLPVETLSSSLGDSFEVVCENLFRRKYPRSKTIKSLFEMNPKNDGVELCDGLLEDPSKNCVIFEMKHAWIPLRAFDPDDQNASKFIDWFDRVFIKQKKEANKEGRDGALFQLAKSAKKINEGILDYKPNSIIPIIVIPDEILFHLPINCLIDMAIDEFQIFKDIPNIHKAMVMSLGELDYITSYSFDSVDRNLFWLIQQKIICEGTDSRIISWREICKRVEGKYNIPKDHDTIFNNLLQKTKTYVSN